MKTFARNFILTLLLVLGLSVSVVLTGCGGSEIKSIAVDTTNVDLVFEVGSEFNSDNLVVYAKQNDGNNVRVKNGDYTVTVPDTSVAGKKIVTILYGEMTVTYEIEVMVKEVVATFTGDIQFGLGGGRSFIYSGEFKCYNTLVWELVGTSAMGNFTDSGKYKFKDGVYTMIMGSGTNVSTVIGENGTVSFDYEGFGIKILNGMMTANGHGTLVLGE